MLVRNKKKTCIHAMEFNFTHLNSACISQINVQRKVLHNWKKCRRINHPTQCLSCTPKYANFTQNKQVPDVITKNRTILDLCTTIHQPNFPNCNFPLLEIRVVRRAHGKTKKKEELAALNARSFKRPRGSKRSSETIWKMTSVGKRETSYLANIKVGRITPFSPSFSC